MAHSRRTARTSPPHRWPGDSGGMPTNAEHPHGDTTADTPGHSSSPWDLTTEPTQPTSVESPWVTPPAAGGTASPAPPVAGPPSGTHRLPPWRRRAVGTATRVAVALGGGATGAAVTARYVGGRTTTVTTSATPAGLTGTSSAPTEPLAQVAAAVQPSVVSVTVTTSSGGDEGSGVILRSDGTILTNNHVVEAAASTTWLLVRMVPSERRMTPDPSSPPLDVVTVTETTLGWTAAATCASGSVGALDVPVSPAGVALVVTVVVRPPTYRAVTAAPVAPPPRATATRVAVPTARRRHGGRRCVPDGGPATGGGGSAVPSPPAAGAAGGVNHGDSAEAAEVDPVVVSHGEGLCPGISAVVSTCGCSALVVMPAESPGHLCGPTVRAHSPH